MIYTKLNKGHYDALTKSIYDLLMQNDDMGLGEMVDCQDVANTLVNEWMKVGNIELDESPLSFTLADSNVTLTCIVDINGNDYPERFIQKLKDDFIIYEDRVLREHIYNVDDALESIEDGADNQYNFDPEEIMLLHELIQLKERHNAAYIRVIYE